MIYHPILIETVATHERGTASSQQSGWPSGGPVSGLLLSLSGLEQSCAPWPPVSIGNVGRRNTYLLKMLSR